jgi:hypothetical protein
MLQNAMPKHQNKRKEVVFLINELGLKNVRLQHKYKRRRKCVNC